MRLSDLSINRPVTALMLIMVIIVLGVVSFTRLTIDLLPNLQIPVAIVITNYSGAGPQEMESMVTRPVEEAIATVSNIKTLSSTSSEGLSTVVAEFDWGIDMDFATLQMREKVDMIRRLLPEGASEPQIIKIDPTMIPVMQIGVIGGEDEAALKEYAEKTVKTRLERIDGVASVEIYGGLEREILLEVDPYELQSYGLSIQQLAQALTMENMNVPGGQVQEGQNKLLVRTIGEFQTVDDIGNVLVNLPRGGQMYLRDIAQISDGFKEATSYININGQPSTMLIVNKQSGANSVQVSDRLHRELTRLEDENPYNMNFVVAMDQATFIKESISQVTQSAVSGAFLAVMILLIFLRNFRSTLIIGTAIPISIIATFTIMYFANLTLNMMTLGGLALGVGMLVDNAIVVLENIYRYREEGYSRKEAAKLGAREVGMTITASTMTTVSVFLPVVFVQGMAAQIFKELALTVSFSLLASLLVSLTIIPLFSSRIMKVNGKNGLDDGKKTWNVFTLFHRWLERVKLQYQGALAWALDRRKRVVVGVLFMFIMSFVLIPFVGMDFFPPTDEGEIHVNYSLPRGRMLEESDQVASQIEDVLRTHAPEIDILLTQVGGGGGGFGSGGADRGSMYVKLVPKAERQRSTDEIVEVLRQETAGMAGVRVTYQAGSMMGGGGMGGSGAPIQMKIKGDDLDQLWALADQIEGKLEEVPGTRQVTSSLGEGQPEFQLRVHREKAASYGLNTATVANALRSAISGQTATRLKQDGREIDVRIQVGEEQRRHLHHLLDLPISSPAGLQVPLRDVAEIVEAQGPTSIRRENQTRVITVSSHIQGRDLRSVSNDIQAALGEVSIPPGYQIEFGGDNQEMMEAFGSLALALLLAIILVYMIMASQFESLIHPFTIMFTLPMAFIGVVLGLVISGRTLSVPAFIGCIMLAGIVVNNAIVLVDYINTLRERGMERKEAILQAGPTRLRPILMTTLTTILGLVPLTLGLGEGAELSAPLATVVTGGLLFSTVLTLIIIPVVYTILEDVWLWLKGFILRKKGKPSVEGAEG